MVKPRFLIATLSVLFILVTLVGTVAAQRQYQLDHEYAEIWINPEDGTIDLLYDISLTLNSGSAIKYVEIGQPTGDFMIGEAVDQQGHILLTTDNSSENDYKVGVSLNSPLTAGQTVRFSLITNVAGMIWEDTQNSGNVGIQFTPTWWDEASVLDLRVLIVLPSGVTQDMIKTSVDWNNIQSEDGRLAVYWERSLSPGQKADFGVSFPEEYVDVYETRDAVSEFLQEYLGVLLLFGVVGIGVIVGGLFETIVTLNAKRLVPKVVICPANVYFNSRICVGVVVSNPLLIRKNKHIRSKNAGIKNGPIKRKAFDIHSNIPFFSFFGDTLP